MRGVLLGIAADRARGRAGRCFAFVLAGARELPRGAFIWFKASFAAFVGVLVTPPLGWWALMDALRAARTGRVTLAGRIFRLRKAPSLLSTHRPTLPRAPLPRRSTTRHGALALVDPHAHLLPW